jgi:anti-anti-sigma factor
VESTAGCVRHQVTIGEIDSATVEAFGAELSTTAALAEPGDVVELDLRSVTFMDSTGLSALLDARRDLAHDGHRLVIRHASGPVLRIISVTGLDHLLTD